MAERVAPLMLGLRGATLAADEIAFIEDVRPAAFILFARNIKTPEQVRDLTAALAELSPLETPLIAVDQEGGRVQRVTWGGRLPPMQIFGKWHDENPVAAREAVRLAAFLLAAQLRDVGATWALAPCLDIAHPLTHKIIGDRAFHADPQVVTALGRAHLEGTEQGGCFPCLKHAPGHGRAVADSHVELPTVTATADELAEDFAPFQALAAESPFIMTAHIHYAKLMNAKGPATFSREMLGMMRDEWGFGGLILADDLGMEALSGTYRERAVKALSAGCDLLITSFSRIRQGMAGTVFDEESYAAMRDGGALPPLGEGALAKLGRLRLGRAPDAEDVADARTAFHKLWADGPARLGYKLDV
jgi:beta-N-acetylhexosaminidase